MGCLSVFPVGGGVKLRVKAYAAVGDLPASDKEGAVAAITAIPIKDIYAQGSEPGSPATGDVWVLIGASNMTPITIEDHFIVYGRAVFQYDGSGWELLDSYVYTSNVWVQMTLFVYYYGAFILADSFSRAYYAGGNCYITINTDTIQVHVNNDPDDQGRIDGYTTTAVDLTDINVVKIKYSSPTDTRVANNMRLEVAAVRGSTPTAYAALTPSASGTGFLDVSGLSGLYYIGYHAETKNLSYGMNGDHYIYELKLEV